MSSSPAHLARQSGMGFDFSGLNGDALRPRARAEAAADTGAVLLDGKEVAQFDLPRVQDLDQFERHAVDLVKVLVPTDPRPRRALQQAAAATLRRGVPIFPRTEPGVSSHAGPAALTLCAAVASPVDMRDHSVAQTLCPHVHVTSGDQARASTPEAPSDPPRRSRQRVMAP